MTSLLERFITGQGSIIHLIQNSPDFSHCFANNVKGLGAAAVSNSVKNLSYAKHRFDSASTPLGRFIRHAAASRPLVVIPFLARIPPPPPPPSSPVPPCFSHSSSMSSFLGAPPSPTPLHPPLGGGGGKRGGRGSNRVHFIPRGDTASARPATSGGAAVLTPLGGPSTSTPLSRDRRCDGYPRGVRTTAPPEVAGRSADSLLRRYLGNCM